MLLENLFFPPKCPFCGEVIGRSKAVCDKCVRYLQIAPHKQILPNECVCASLFRHEGVWRTAVINYKFYNNRQYYFQFSLMLSDAVKNVYSGKSFDFYTSVPIHKKRLESRGFDQVKLLARQTAKFNGCVYKPFLKQCQQSEVQHYLSKEKRSSNVKGIYKSVSQEQIQGRSILLFDDIVTTGSTLLECSDVLLNAGASEVCCVTINW